MHWADKFAKQVIERKTKEEFVIESGITPSGIVHIGDFREMFTQYFVFKAIKDLSKKAKFLYIWDDFDRFRKVPKGVDKSFEKYIGMPVSKVPDPWGCHSSYAEHFELKSIEEINNLKIKTQFINATDLYEKCVFAENIKTALEKIEKIKEILNKFRKKPLPEDWLPIETYCEKCWKDSTKSKYLGGYEVQYKCECEYENKIDFRKAGMVKLRWRVDWPSRWQYFGVDFESSGKDHKTYSGSWDTAVLISREIFNYEPPIGPMYEHIFLKGQKEKMSSSKGNVALVSDLLKIYEPSIVRFVYTQRINKAFFIPFDLDVYNVYNEFDKCERIYFGVEKGKEENKRRYELSRTEKYETCPNRISFSELVFLTQFLPKEKFKEKLSEMMKKRGINLSDLDLGLAEERAEKARKWVENYAPENVKFQLSYEEIELTDREKEEIRKLEKLMKDDTDTDKLQKQIFELSKEYGKEIFQTAYKVLIGKTQGPRLAYLMDTIGREKVIRRFEEVC
jgi:lysyl-tRNA synthetase class 1